ncbi:MAG: accessory gene regulator B family protein [bacterium]|nr:accessory gene regulator B family protein [bacterium]
MEQLSAMLAKKISLSQGFSEEKEQVITYGLIAMIQFFSLLFIVTIIGAFFNFTYESIVIFLGVGFLRKSTGGAHSSTMRGCMILSTLNITLLAFLSRYTLMFPIKIYYCLVIYVACYLICFYIVYTYAPLDSPNKKITSKNKISRLRKQSLILLVIYCISNILFIIFSKYTPRCQSIANSICLLTLWQCFTITPAGVTFIHFIDKSFNNH